MTQINSSQEQKLRNMIHRQNYQISLLRNKFFALQEALLTSGIINPYGEIDERVRYIVPVEKRILENSDTLVVIFSGMATQLSMPPAEFMRTFLSKNISVIFIKDFWQCWYQKGLLGISNNIQDTVTYLRQELSEISYKKLVFIGTSAGGYASLLFGNLLNADNVLCFSPQTNIQRKVFNRFKSQDSRLKDIDFNCPYLDLNQTFKLHDYSGKINIYFGEHNLVDKEHASNLIDFEYVNLIPLATDSHNTAEYLKEQGKLDKILEAKINLV